MEYQSLDRVPPDKVVGTTAHTIGELNLSTQSGRPIDLPESGQLATIQASRWAKSHRLDAAGFVDSVKRSRSRSKIAQYVDLKQLFTREADFV
jgi:hypothetical protein